MNQHEERIKIIKKYADQIKTAFSFHVGNAIPEKKIQNARKKYAEGLDKKTIIGLYDTTVLETGKEGYVFTDDKVYYLTTLEKPKKLWYDDIESIQLIECGKKDCDNKILFKLFDGTELIWSDNFVNKKPLVDFFKEIIDVITRPLSEQFIDIEAVKQQFEGATAGGVSAGAYGQVNKLYDEEKFHARQGHGYAAERANNLYDKLTGHEAKIVGDDNVKNGADRVVDDVLIQSKYCQSGKACVDECFDSDGNFRYWENGKPMLIEVPSDKYDAAVKAMEDKIRDGKIPGITNPEEAKNIIRKGHFTYAQARNIAKAGTIESLTYDSVHGVIIASSAFGVTALITFATNLWNGEDFGKSLKIATFSGLKVGGTAFITTVLASQLSKAGLNSALVGSSEAIVGIMGPKAAAVLVNAFRNGSNIYGAAAMKSAAKLLRGNVITAGVSVVVLSSFDIANIFRRRISGKQLFKNMSSTVTTVAGGTGGWLGGAAIGSAILPGAGTVIGGLAGSIIAGGASGKVTNAVLDKFIEDDADEMVRIIQQEFEALALEYLLNAKEVEKSIDKLQKELDGKKLKDMFASKDRTQYARNMLVPIIESTIRCRRKIKALSDEQIAGGLKNLLEDIADSIDDNMQLAY